MTAMVGLAACTQAAGQPASSPTPETAPTPAGSWVAGSFASEAGTREYQLYVPGNYDPARRHMLVVLLHGCTQDPMDLARGTRIADHAERGGFLALLPAQPQTANAMKCWSWFDERHQSRDAGEPALIAGMTADISRKYAVDPANIHLGGISAGGAMASLVAVAYPEVYASVALHSAPAWRAATDMPTALRVMANGSPDAEALGAMAVAAMGSRARAIPAFVIHGAKDAVVKPANGRDAVRQWLATNRQAGGASDAPTVVESSGESGGYSWTRACHGYARGPCLVEEWTVAELGHAWSGGSPTGTFTDEHGPDATAEIVRFFREHGRQAR